jgi:hypothetical protein
MLEYNTVPPEFVEMRHTPTIAAVKTGVAHMEGVEGEDNNVRIVGPSATALDW